MATVVSDDAFAEAPVETPAAKPPSRKRAFVFVSLSATVLALGGGWYLHGVGREATDDAQVDADVVALPSRVGGVVQKVLFTDNQTVHAGDVLAELDDAPARARLAQAEAALEAATRSAEAADADARVAATNARGNEAVAKSSLSGATSSAQATSQQVLEARAALASAQVGYDKASTDLGRAQTLFSTGAISQAELDRNKAAFDTASALLDQSRARLAVMDASTSQAWSRVSEANARLLQASQVDVVIAQANARAQMAHAQVATAKAARDLAALELSYTKIVAPADGVLSKRAIAVGQMLAPGQAIGQLVPAGSVWVTANFKETQLASMRPGQPATISVDAFPGKQVRGEVETFAAATGAKFALLPPDNATGNYTKVVQRVPVRVKLTDVPAGLSLRPGMSVEVVVRTRG
jgi:membrane fusion protein (multidrug efflux system)